MLLAASMLIVFVAPVRADIDESAYEASGAVRGEKERQRLKAQFERDMEAERRRAQAEAEAEALMRAEALAREAARPYPERLTERQCTACHKAENYAEKRHTWIYWRLVVARMVLLNDAAIDSDDQAVIAAYLADAYPADLRVRLLEYGGPVAALILIAGAAWTGKRMWNHLPGRLG